MNSLIDSKMNSNQSINNKKRTFLGNPKLQALKQLKDKYASEIEYKDEPANKDKQKQSVKDIEKSKTWQEIKAESRNLEINSSVEYLSLSHLDKSANRNLTKKTNYKVPTSRTKFIIPKNDEKIKSANKNFKRAILTAYNPKSLKNNMLQQFSSPLCKQSKEKNLCNTLDKLKNNQNLGSEGVDSTQSSTDVSHEDFITSLIARKYKPALPGFEPPKRRLKNLGMKGNISNLRRPLHDPYAEKALVLYSPPEMTKDEYMKADKTKLLVHVVVDPILGNVLRPHQREGVKFMYDCVAEGLRFMPLIMPINKPKKKKKKKNEPEVTESEEAVRSSSRVTDSAKTTSSLENSEMTCSEPKQADISLLDVPPEKVIPIDLYSIDNSKSTKIWLPGEKNAGKELDYTGQTETTLADKEVQGYGCILADDMGLGKTLQCVALMFTLIKQSKIMSPLTEKVIVVSPSSLVKNWENEVKKWLKSRVSTLAIASGSLSRDALRKQLQGFMDQCPMRHSTPVMFISYESLRGHIDILLQQEIGMIICDEGHRLKNAENQTYLALNSLNCKRRVLLSGTPIQNDLLEYFALVSFVNPGSLGTAMDFRRHFENPILKGRDSFASPEEQQKGDERLKELLARVNSCMLRRTAEILVEYLPIKHELIVAVPLTDLQQKLYVKYGDDMANLQQMKSATERKEYRAKGAKTQSSSLQVITYLRKICAHPTLMYEALTKTDSAIPVNDKKALLELFPSNFKGGEIDSLLSGKMVLLDSILAVTRSTSDDRFVLVSNFTETLELCERLCKKRQYKFVRLDGSMSVKKRAKIVADFNIPPEGHEPVFIFMLSSKAGGCGLNIIGANRLIMFEPDWNPANDGQAMARVWRDGQKKTCFIYRFVNTGTIDEKIFQRQAHKKALSSCVVDGQQDVDRHFSVSELRELFRLNKKVICETHDKLKCKRCAKGDFPMQIEKPDDKSTTLSDLKEWWHCANNKQDRSNLPDKVLQCVWDRSKLTFCMHQQSHKKVRGTI